ncbi:hypothetical protein [Flammeovirga aprica]|uniref:Lipoprotein n=1 Tax=Flammeovirga aprica JL-4 TaxID=694437 RepID=A0A7X9RVU6_9BACT|nr:hypothetical protein [Flammeovirga aprica]NME69631.1 hypothetical protein [Flammeovirga aprica JL-4]
MNKLFAYCLIGLLSVTMFSCFEVEETTEGCTITPELQNVETQFAAELAILEDENSSCEEKKTAGQTVLNFIDENEECIDVAIDFYADSEEQADSLKAEYKEQLPALRILVNIPCL